MSLVGNCVIAQSGGPTSVINASLCGVVQKALKSPEITGVYGSLYGILGIINDNLIDLGKEDPEEIELLKYTPSSALGSCRYKLKPAGESDDYQKILNTFKKYNIRYFFYIGGNDSMDTADKLNKFLNESGHEIRVMGIPKTIDNDLVGTDHCPGFGSAAKYISTIVSEVHQDADVYTSNQVTIIEIMGRNAGWLTASSALASLSGYGPDLIYLPEVPFSVEKFREDVIRIRNEKGSVVVCASEGIKDSSGKYISQMETVQCHDSFGHAQLGGVGNTLKSLISDIEKRIKVIELNIMQRSASHIASKTDIEEAYNVGVKAMEAALNGQSGYMSAIICESHKPYASAYDLVPLSSVANKEKTIPLDWISPEGNGVKQEVIDYILPLVQGSPKIHENEYGMPRYTKLKKIPVK